MRLSEYEQRFPGHLAPALQQIEEALPKAAEAALFDGNTFHFREEPLHLLVKLIGLFLEQFDRGRPPHRGN
jgi:hypothetical protein